MRLCSVRFLEKDMVAIDAGAGGLLGVASLFKDDLRAANLTMIDIIGAGATFTETLSRRFSDWRRAGDRSEAIKAEAVIWHPPVRRPGKICGVAMNNWASNARKVKAPEHPAFFLKPSSCLVGHKEPIVIRQRYGSTHPEPEVAVIIGSVAREVNPSDALDHVFGYSIINDVTSNGMRAEDMFHYYALYADDDDLLSTKRVEQHLSYAGRYKGSDTFGPMGPWLVTRDEIADPNDLDVSCTVAGEVVAKDSTRHFNYDVQSVIAFISRYQTLEPGDVIALGTAFKLAPGERRSIHTANLALTPGPVDITVGGIGTLSNPVIFAAGD